MVPDSEAGRYEDPKTARLGFSGSVYEPGEITLSLPQISY